MMRRLSNPLSDTNVLKVYRVFERVIVLVLLFLLMLVILYATGEFAVVILKGLWTAVTRRELPVEPAVLHEVFDGFLLLLIGVELMKTVVMYLDEHVVHVEVVFAVAMIAIARDAIDLNYKETRPLAIVALGVVLLSLAVAYFLLKKATHETAARGNCGEPGAES